MKRLNLRRCPAPVRTQWGTLRCVTVRPKCPHAAHRRWDLLRVPMAVLWAVKPWWPNAYGRRLDREGRS